MSAKEYYLSAWTKQLMYVYGTADEREEFIEIQSRNDFLTQYYKEVKLFNLGSYNSDSPYQAINPQFTTDINGSHSLTFSLQYKLFNPETGNTESNIFCDELSNEVIIKLYLPDDKNEPNKGWYDFKIVKVSENTKKYTFEYTCKDTFIDELSKNGYNLEFSTELMNNIGTVTELGKEILDGSEWEVDENSQILQQRITEPLYLCKFKSRTVSGIPCYEDKDDDRENLQLSASGEKNVYIFYSDIVNKNDDFQFIYSKDSLEFDEDNVIISKYCNYTINNSFTALRNQTRSMIETLVAAGIDLYKKEKNEYVKVDNPLLDIDSIYYKKYYAISKDKRIFWGPGVIPLSTELITNFQGRKLIKTQKSRYNNVLNQMVYSYGEKKNLIKFTPNPDYIQIKTKYSQNELISDFFITTNDYTNIVALEQCKIYEFIDNVYQESAITYIAVNNGEQYVTIYDGTTEENTLVNKFIQGEEKVVCLDTKLQENGQYYVYNKYTSIESGDNDGDWMVLFPEKQPWNSLTSTVLPGQAGCLNSNGDIETGAGVSDYFTLMTNGNFPTPIGNVFRFDTIVRDSGNNIVDINIGDKAAICFYDKNGVFLSYQNIEYGVSYTFSSCFGNSTTGATRGMPLNAAAVNISILNTNVEYNVPYIIANSVTASFLNINSPYYRCLEDGTTYYLVDSIYTKDEDGDITGVIDTDNLYYISSLDISSIVSAIKVYPLIESDDGLVSVPDYFSGWSYLNETNFDGTNKTFEFFGNSNFYKEDITLFGKGLYLIIDNQFSIQPSIVENGYSIVDTPIYYKLDYTQTLNPLYIYDDDSFYLLNNWQQNGSPLNTIPNIFTKIEINGETINYITVSNPNSVDAVIYDNEVEGYVKENYTTRSTVTNMVSNSCCFKTSSGWFCAEPSLFEYSTDIPIWIYPNLDDPIRLKESNDINSGDIKMATNLEFHLVNCAPTNNVTKSPSIYNRGFNDNALKIGSLSVGDEWVYRLRCRFYSGKVGTKSNTYYNIYENRKVRIVVAEYKITPSGQARVKEDFIIFRSDLIGGTDGAGYIHSGYASMSGADTASQSKFYYEGKLSCLKNVSLYDLTHKDIGIFLILSPNSGEGSSYFYLNHLELFPYVPSDNYSSGENLSDVISGYTGLHKNAWNNQLLPIDVGEEITSKKILLYNYYNKEENEIYTDEEDYKYIYSDYVPSDKYSPIYLNYYEKKRTIEGKESNRFNLIQGLDETFKCWSRFDIYHLESGQVEYLPNYRLTTDLSILGDKVYYIKNGESFTPLSIEQSEGYNINSLYEFYYKPNKKVYFYEQLDEINYAGIKYGVNLNSISRTVDSEKIITKMIVKNNSNKYAKNGFCTISRAEDNGSKLNYILNFDYYIRQGILNKAEIVKDLYGSDEYHLGFLEKISLLNIDKVSLNDKLDSYSNSLNELQSDLTVYETGYGKSYQEYLKALDDFERQAQKPWNIFMTTVLTNADDAKRWKTDESLRNKNTTVLTCKQNMNEYLRLQKQAQKNIDEVKSKISDIENYIAEREEKISRLEEALYNKYTNYIQEGTWNSNDYIDDNLYYLDGCNVSATSAMPQITYNFDLVDISILDGYSPYKLKVGIRTWVQDPEYFGYSDIENKTPYKESVIISNIVQNLRQPSKNKVTVKNYFTAFEDLFKRIAATTQAVQNKQGYYDRAAGIVNNNGAISLESLQGCIDSNAIKIGNAQNQSVTLDERGIITQDLVNSNEIVRIVGGGIFCSTDGGNTWSTGITGNGINASLITTGILRTENVEIVNGSNALFKWNKYGIHAYSLDNLLVPNTNKFVRFDQYGIYGIDGNYSDELENSIQGIYGLETVKENSLFSLTWEGLRFNIKDDNGVMRKMLVANSNGLYVGGWSFSWYKMEATSGGSPRKYIKVADIYANGDSSYSISDNEDKIVKTRAWYNGGFNVSCDLYIRGNTVVGNVLYRNGILQYQMIDGARYLVAPSYESWNTGTLGEGYSGGYGALLMHRPIISDGILLINGTKQAYITVSALATACGASFVNMNLLS